jgi:hypothetical protein
VDDQPRDVARVIYEDSLGPSGRFLFHEFICACVDDALALHYVARQHIVGIPKRGANKALDAASEGTLYANNARVFVVLDSDRIHRALNLDASTPRPEVMRALALKAPLAAFVLLEHNLESVVAAAIKCLGGVDANLQAGALVAKSITDRDIVLGKLATAQLRRCVLGEVQSLEPLVTALTDLLRAQTPSA